MTSLGQTGCCIVFTNACRNNYKIVPRINHHQRHNQDFHEFTIPSRLYDLHKREDAAKIEESQADAIYE